MIAYSEWLLVFLELVALTLINLLAPFLWIRAESIENVKLSQNFNKESIIDSISEIEDFTKGMDCDNFKKDKKTILAVIMEIEVIAELIKKISKITKIKHKEIPWNDITKLREKVCHKNFGRDLDILWNMIQKDLPTLKSTILTSLNNLQDKQYNTESLKVRSS